MNPRSKSPRSGRSEGKSIADLKNDRGSDNDTFLTQTKQDGSIPYTLHDMIFPGGIVAKLVGILQILIMHLTKPYKI